MVSVLFIRFVRCSGLIILNGVCCFSRVKYTQEFAVCLWSCNCCITTLALLFIVEQISIGGQANWHGFKVCSCKVRTSRSIFYAYNTPPRLWETVIKDPLWVILGCYDCYTARPEEFISLQLRHFCLPCCHLDLQSVCNFPFPCSPYSVMAQDTKAAPIILYGAKLQLLKPLIPSRPAFPQESLFFSAITAVRHILWFMFYSSFFVCSSVQQQDSTHFVLFHFDVRCI